MTEQQRQIRDTMTQGADPYQGAPLYHGTSRAAAAAIEKEGLKPNDKDPTSGIYASPKPDVAEFYAEDSKPRDFIGPADPGVVFEIGIPKEFWEDVVPSTPRQHRIYGGKIPPQWLKKVKG
jgi:hypothetical protein